MARLTRVFVYISMLLLSCVSAWTTYVSLRDSIFPEPSVPISLGSAGIWNCSLLALGLSVAIGLMLFALKLAIVDGQKRLSASGIVGLCVVAFISIVFNMDVLYRTADREFFVRYSTATVKDPYVAHLARVHSDLTARRTELQRQVAKQRGELVSEISGLRSTPAGYGSRARAEEYRLTMLEHTAAVELEAIDAALASRRSAEDLLSSEQPTSIEEVELLQARLRVAAKDAGALAGLSPPEHVRLANPLFAVFARLFDWRSVGVKELFFLAIALFLDLGDVLGYSLVSSRTAPAEDPRVARGRTARRSLGGTLRLPGRWAAGRYEHLRGAWQVWTGVRQQGPVAAEPLSAPPPTISAEEPRHS